MSDWTRGDDPVYDGYRESWKEQAEAEYEVDRAEEEERHDIIVGITTARLRELADAEREGRVVVLPYKDQTEVVAVFETTAATGEERCKVGQNCFYCSDDCPNKERVRRFNGYEKRKLWMHFMFYAGTSFDLAKRVGKDVFLTEEEADTYIAKAEAERALAAADAGKGENGCLE